MNGIKTHLHEILVSGCVWPFLMEICVHIEHGGFWFLCTERSKIEAIEINAQIIAIKY